MSFRDLPGGEGKGRLPSHLLPKVQPATDIAYCCREIPLVTYNKRPQTHSNQVHEQMRTRQCTSKAITIAAVMKTIKVVDLDNFCVHKLYVLVCISIVIPSRTNMSVRDAVT